MLVLAQQQQPITERVYYTAWPVTPNLCNWPITDGLSSKVWKCCVREGDCFKVPSGTLGSAAWAARHGPPGARGWYSLWTGVYDVWKVWTLTKMPWPGIKFTDFSRVLGKLVKFLDFSRAGKHFFCICPPFPEFPDRWEPCEMQPKPYFWDSVALCGSITSNPYYSAVPLRRCQFSPISLEQTPHSSPTRMRYGVSVVSFKSDSCSAAVNAVWCVKLQ